MKIFIALLIFGMTLLSGCSQSDSEKVVTEPIQNTTDEAQSSPDISVSGTDSVVNSNTTTSNVSSPNVSTQPADKLNPPHGELGHRCDIAVGSPLNSPPVNPPGGNTQITNTAPGTQAPVNTTPGTQAPVKTAPGMNPPHGEAGHDCTIPVGAPLKK